MFGRPYSTAKSLISSPERQQHKAHLQCCDVAVWQRGEHKCQARPIVLHLLDLLLNNQLLLGTLHNLTAQHKMSSNGSGSDTCTVTVQCPPTLLQQGPKLGRLAAAPCMSPSTDSLARVFKVVQSQSQEVTQAELLIHDKVLAGCLHQHLPVPVPHCRLVQVLQVVQDKDNRASGTRSPDLSVCRNP